MGTYCGKIWLKTGGHPVLVQISASSPSAVTKAIEAQYSGVFKSWALHMAQNNC